VQAHLFRTDRGQVLDPEIDLEVWLERVLADAAPARVVILPLLPQP
jgi:hypothetical protein